MLVGACKRPQVAVCQCFLAAVLPAVSVLPALPWPHRRALQCQPHASARIHAARCALLAAGLYRAVLCVVPLLPAAGTARPCSCAKQGRPRCALCPASILAGPALLGDVAQSSSSAGRGVFVRKLSLLTLYHLQPAVTVRLDPPSTLPAAPPVGCRGRLGRRHGALAALGISAGVPGGGGAPGGVVRQPGVPGGTRQAHLRAGCGVAGAASRHGQASQHRRFPQGSVTPQMCAGCMLPVHRLKLAAPGCFQKALVNKRSTCRSLSSN